jgi:chaperone required for assembly of F1-ATPase
MAKRFWTDVTLDQDGDGHFIRLDGRALKTPNKMALRVPTHAIAGKLKAEWDAVPLAHDGDIDPNLMPVTRLANVASEGARERRDELINEVQSYASTDLLCYRTPEPAEFVKRQANAWDPWLDWAATRGITLKTTESLLAIEQDPKSLKAVSAYAARLNGFALTLFVHLTAVYGSAILAMAVMEGELEPDRAFDLSRLDELYREEIWGVDEEAAAQRAALRDETATLGTLAKDI